VAFAAVRTITEIGGTSGRLLQALRCAGGVGRYVKPYQGKARQENAALLFIQLNGRFDSTGK
jgi:hypothetical protein